MTNASAPPVDLKALIRSKAAILGLDAIGFARIEEASITAERLRTFLAEGRHGDMDWMADNADKRSDPTRLWPDAKTAILIGQSYAPEANPLDALQNKDRAIVSVYAQGRDYHDVVKKKIKALARALATAAGADVKVFVDTAPLMEKPLAARAGLGWQGKHTNLVSRAHGNWLFLGAILTTADIEADEAETDHCGTCRRCLEICPTNAFPAPYELDARRCLAYLTIEHKGHIAREFRIAMGNRVFGCDDCLAICPWNKFAATASEIRFSGRPETANPPLAELLVLDDAAFRTRFAGTPVKRTGRNRVVRNALIAAGNSGDGAFLSLIVPLLDDASPLVRAAAIWALRRLAPASVIAREQRRRDALETDAEVKSEWLGDIASAAA